ncbi:hypothetical protein V1477_013296, partial [Vespula maculifrons]
FYILCGWQSPKYKFTILLVLAVRNESTIRFYCHYEPTNTKKQPKTLSPIAEIPFYFTSVQQESPLNTNTPTPEYATVRGQGVGASKRCSANDLTGSVYIEGYVRGSRMA